MSCALYCPHCSEEVFSREEDSFGEDEQEVCSTCGMLCIVGIEESDDPPTAYVQYTEIFPNGEKDEVSE